MNILKTYSNKLNNCYGTQKKHNEDGIADGIKETFFDSPAYRKIYLNLDTTKTYDSQIVDSDADKTLIPSSTCIMYPYQTLKSGDYVGVINEDSTVTQFLCTSSDRRYPWKNKGKIKRTQRMLVWKIGNIKYEYPCSVDDSVSYGGFMDSQVVVLPQNKIVVKVQLNQDTYKIPINARFIMGDCVFKVETHNRYASPDPNHGVLTFTMELDQRRDKDDFSNGIADNSTINWTIDNTLPTGTLSYYLTPSTRKVSANKTEVFYAKKFVNGVEDLTFVPTIEYVSNIATGYTVTINNSQITIQNKDAKTKLFDFTIKDGINVVISEQIKLSMY